MALSLLAANNAQTVLAAGISSSATTLTVNTGTGSLFPSPSAGVSFFKLTLIDAATGQISEIIHVNARSGDTMTIERGQEGTTARAWSANDIAANMMTAGTLSYILGNFQPLDATLTAIADLATSANKLAYFTGTDAAALTDITSIGRSVIGQSTLSSLQAYLGMGAAAFLGVATNADMQTGTSTTLLSTAAGVNSLLPKRTFSANDYIRIPDAAGGLIIQWGVATSLPTGTGIATITYPTPFPNGPKAISLTRYWPNAPTATQGNPTVTNVTNSNFSLNISDSVSVNAMWIAIGN